ncbi:MAG TPA: HisA/HisF-related TIM barrel protein [Candidatus Thermoplasmatota archaeon]|nr:HisA/HisF-related TIM barrel protein [Candidatus Thermoplasmatota archaeon]
MQLVPAAHVRRGRLTDAGGASLPPGSEERLAQAAGDGPAYLVDLEGLSRNRPDVEFLQRWTRRRPAWADTGAGTLPDVADSLVAGAERVTVRWSRLPDGESDLLDITEASDSVVLGLEFEGRFVANRADARDLRGALALASELSLPVLVIDLARAGKRAGVDAAIANEVASLHAGERWFAGGVRDASDAARLQEMGYAGAIASALLDGPLR